MSENARNRSGITAIYPDFVKMVNPKGYVIDLLIQRRVLNEETAEQLRRIESRENCCVSMLNEVLKCRNPEAFIALRAALQQDYAYIVKDIDEATTGTNQFKHVTNRPTRSTYSYRLC